MFHMPGKWEFVFEVRAGGKTDRLASAFQLSQFTQEEIAKILQHGPWPPPPARDPSNRVSGKPEAIAFGEKLFFEPRLSGTGSVLCATCHAPFRAFQDARPRAFGLQEVDRNTPTRAQRALLPLVRLGRRARQPVVAEHPAAARRAGDERDEPRMWPGSVRKLLATEYEAAFARQAPAEDEQVLVDVGKALAAFQETLVSGRTPFDEFRDALRTRPGLRLSGAAQSAG